MSSYVTAELRRLVVERARGLCEYCLLHESDTYLGCQVDHVISDKHGGATVAENLALACAFCNRAKGSDVGSLTAVGTFSRFFNPRTDIWTDHFALDGVRI
jgi:5-methylcytosine-specific restriction endonuclease McrA